MPRINEVLVPPRRLGALLRESRVTAGEDLADVASRSDRLTAVDLDDLEHGRRTLDDAILREVVDMYGVEGTNLLPQRSRLMIDLQEGLISVDATHLAIGAERGPDAVLVRYVALVHRLRGIPVGTALKIRELDIGVLATALELHHSDIERRLKRLMTDGESLRASERDLRRRLLIPLAGVVVASTAVGVLLLVSDDTRDIGDPDPNRIMVQNPPNRVQPKATRSVGESAEITTDIANAVILESGRPQAERD